MSTPIKREDIRKGDRVRMIWDFTALCDITTVDPDAAATYELIERPVTLPTVPGVYRSSLVGSMHLWLSEDGKWHSAAVRCHNPKRHMPLTLLRPVAEVVAEVLKDVASEFDKCNPVSISSDLCAVAARWDVSL